MIDVMVSNFKNQYREELKQDLYLSLLNSFQNNIFCNAKNLDNYIFVCLKNQAVFEYKSKYSCSVEILSLDKTSKVTGSPLINSIADDGDEGENEVRGYYIPIKN